MTQSEPGPERTTGRPGRDEQQQEWETKSKTMQNQLIGTTRNDGVDGDGNPSGETTPSAPAALVSAELEIKTTDGPGAQLLDSTRLGARPSDRDEYEQQESQQTGSQNYGNEVAEGSCHGQLIGPEETSEAQGSVQPRVLTAAQPVLVRHGLDLTRIEAADLPRLNRLKWIGETRALTIPDLEAGLPTLQIQVSTAHGRYIGKAQYGQMEVECMAYTRTTLAQRIAAELADQILHYAPDIHQSQGASQQLQQLGKKIVQQINARRRAGKTSITALREAVELLGEPTSLYVEESYDRLDNQYFVEIRYANYWSTGLAAQLEHARTRAVDNMLLRLSGINQTIGGSAGAEDEQCALCGTDRENDPLRGPLRYNPLCGHFVHPACESRVERQVTLREIHANMSASRTSRIFRTALNVSRATRPTDRIQTCQVGRCTAPTHYAVDGTWQLPTINVNRQYDGHGSRCDLCNQIQEITQAGELGYIYEGLHPHCRHGFHEECLRRYVEQAEWGAENSQNQVRDPFTVMAEANTPSGLVLVRCPECQLPLQSFPNTNNYDHFVRVETATRALRLSGTLEPTWTEGLAERMRGTTRPHHLGIHQIQECTAVDNCPICDEEGDGQPRYRVTPLCTRCPGICESCIRPYVEHGQGRQPSVQAINTAIAAAPGTLYAQALATLLRDNDGSRLPNLLNCLRCFLPIPFEQDGRVVFRGGVAHIPEMLFAQLDPELETLLERPLEPPPVVRPRYRAPPLIDVDAVEPVVRNHPHNLSERSRHIASFALGEGGGIPVAYMHYSQVMPHRANRWERLPCSYTAFAGAVRAAVVRSLRQPSDYQEAVATAAHMAAEIYNEHSTLLLGQYSMELAELSNIVAVANTRLHAQGLTGPNPIALAVPTAHAQFERATQAIDLQLATRQEPAPSEYSIVYLNGNLASNSMILWTFRTPNGSYEEWVSNQHYVCIVPMHGPQTESQRDRAVWSEEAHRDLSAIPAPAWDLQAEALAGAVLAASVAERPVSQDAPHVLEVRTFQVGHNLIHETEQVTAGPQICHQEALTRFALRPPNAREPRTWQDYIAGPRQQRMVELAIAVSEASSTAQLTRAAPPQPEPEQIAVEPNGAGSTATPAQTAPLEQEPTHPSTVQSEEEQAPGDTEVDRDESATSQELGTQEAETTGTGETLSADAAIQATWSEWPTPEPMLLPPESTWRTTAILSTIPPPPQFQGKTMWVRIGGKPRDLSRDVELWGGASCNCHLQYRLLPCSHILTRTLLILGPGATGTPLYRVITLLKQHNFAEWSGRSNRTRPAVVEGQPCWVYDDGREYQTGQTVEVSSTFTPTAGYTVGDHTLPTEMATSQSGPNPHDVVRLYRPVGSRMAQFRTMLSNTFWHNVSTLNLKSMTAALLFFLLEMAVRLAEELLLRKCHRHLFERAHLGLRLLVTIGRFLILRKTMVYTNTFGEKSAHALAATFPSLSFIQHAVLPMFKDVSPKPVATLIRDPALQIVLPGANSEPQRDLRNYVNSRIGLTPETFALNQQGIIRQSGVGAELDRQALDMNMAVMLSEQAARERSLPPRIAGSGTVMRPPKGTCHNYPHCTAKITRTKKGRTMHLCKTCRGAHPILPGAGRPDPLISEVLDGTQHTGPLPLLPIWSTRFHVPEEVMPHLVPGATISTTMTPQTMGLPENLMNRKVGLGIGYLTTGWMPGHQPFGLTSLLSGLVSRTFQPRNRPLEGAWELVEEAERRHPINIEPSSVLMQNRKHWAQTHRNSERYVPAVEQYERDGYDPERDRVALTKLFIKGEWMLAMERQGYHNRRKRQYKNRGIYNVATMGHVVVGPYYKPLTAALAEGHGPGSHLHYAGKDDPKQLQEWLDRAWPLVASGTHFFVEGDQSRFETTKSFQCNRFRYKKCKTYWAEDDPLRDQVERMWRKLKFHVKNPRTGDTVRGSLPEEMTASGEDGTSFKNSFDNMTATDLVCTLALMGTTVEQFRRAPDWSSYARHRDLWFGAFSGDDFLGVLPKMVANHRIDQAELISLMKISMAQLGFLYKGSTSEKVMGGVFLGQRPYRSGSGYSWGPTLGRRLYKHHCALELQSDPYEWLYQIAKTENLLYPHVPILADMSERALEILQARGIHDRPLKRKDQQKLDRAYGHKVTGRVNTTHYTMETLVETADIYGIEVEDLTEIINQVKAATSLPWGISSLGLDKILQLDN